MKYRVSSILVVLLLAVAVLVTSCSAPTPTPTPTPATTGPAVRQPVEISVYRSTDMSQSYSDTLFVDYIKQKFDLTLKYTYVPSSIAVEKLNLAFATGSYADMLELVDAAQVNRIAKDDFIVPISDHLDKLPNYRSAFSDADWKLLTSTYNDAKGRLYMMPVKMSMGGNSTYVWMFRDSEFEAVGKAIPKTVDELYEALKAIKAVNPNATLPNRWGLINALEGFNLAFRTRFDIWKDPDAGGQIVYGSVTDKFHDLLKYMYKLYDEGLLSKEFVTMTSEQRMAEFSKGNVYANFQFPGYQKNLNNLQKAAGVVGDWQIHDANLVLTAYPDKGPMQQRWGAFYSFGNALTDKLTGDRLDRTLEYLDWSCSNDGQLFHEFGIEGTTYELKDGVPTFMGIYTDAEGTSAASYFGKVQDYGPFGYFLIQNDAHADASYPDAKAVNIALKDVEYMDYGTIPYRFTPEEENRQAELGAILNPIRDEWIQNFVMGVKNPNVDADWQEFLTKLKDAGLDEYLQILRDANARLG
jgi:putative aldouronate transport system substrate-binding protein